MRARFRSMYRYFVALCVLLLLICIFGSPHSVLSDFHQGVDHPVSGLDIVFLIDQSASMWMDISGKGASDPSGLRFDAVQHVISWLANAVLYAHPGLIHRVSLVDFAAEPIIKYLPLDGESDPWIEIAPNDYAEWIPYRMVLSSILQDNLAPTPQAHATDYLAALGTARELFDQLPLDNTRRRVLFLLTDGAPAPVVGLKGPEYLREISRFTEVYFPKPDYVIYIIGLGEDNTSWSEYVENWDPIGQTRELIAVDSAAIGKVLQDILLDLTKDMPSTVIFKDIAIKHEYITVPPFLERLSLTFFLSGPAEMPTVFTGKEELILGSGHWVENHVIEENGDSIYTLYVQNPYPGRWQIEKKSDNSIMMATNMRYIVAGGGLLEKPVGAQLQYQLTEIQYSFTNDLSVAAGNYAESAYRLDLSADLYLADEFVESINLVEDVTGQTSTGFFVPTDSGRHEVHVRGVTQDAEGNGIVLFEQFVGGFEVQSVAWDCQVFSGSTAGTSGISITCQLEDEQGELIVNEGLRPLADINCPGITDIIEMSKISDGVYSVGFHPRESGKCAVQIIGEVVDSSQITHIAFEEKLEDIFVDASSLRQISTHALTILIIALISVGIIALALWVWSSRHGRFLSADISRTSLEERRLVLREDLDAGIEQLVPDLRDVNRKCIERQIEDVDAQLQGAPVPQTSASAIPLDPEPPALQMARRALAILETQAGAYAASEIPVHLQLDLEEKRKQVEELEARWCAGKL